MLCAEIKRVPLVHVVFFKPRHSRPRRETIYMTEINADCAVGVLADLASRTTTFRNFALKFDTKENTCKRHFYKYKPSRTASEFNLTLSEEKLYPLGKVLT